jgi:hypothetical protein
MEHTRQRKPAKASESQQKMESVRKRIVARASEKKSAGLPADGRDVTLSLPGLVGGEAKERCHPMPWLKREGR